MKRDVVTVALPRALRERFERLKKSRNYKSWSYFVNTVMTQKIEDMEREERGD